LDIIYSYTRKQALEDGVLIDVTETAKEAGFVIPVAVTNGLYAEYIEPSESLKNLGQTTNGRLWDVLFMLHLKIHNCPKANTVIYTVAFEKENGMTDEINLKAVIDGGDDGNPVLTIMKENED
jgi:hypothetical protein